MSGVEFLIVPHFVRSNMKVLKETQVTSSKIGLPIKLVPLIYNNKASMEKYIISLLLVFVP
jgi:hypothetical protein